MNHHRCCSFSKMTIDLLVLVHVCDIISLLMNFIYEHFYVLLLLLLLRFYYVDRNKGKNLVNYARRAEKFHVVV